MIYLIGGARGAGKTSLAEKILRERYIPYYSTDILYNTLRYAYPELRIDAEPWRKSFFPCLRELVKHLNHTNRDFVIEGDAFTPEQAHELAENFSVRPLFMGSNDDWSAIIQKECARYRIPYFESKDGSHAVDEAYRAIFQK